MEDIFIAWRILDFQILFTFPWQQLIVHMWLERATSKLENFRFGQRPFGGEFLVISGWKPLFCLCGKRPPSAIVFFRPVIIVSPHSASFRIFLTFIDIRGQATDKYFPGKAFTIIWALRMWGWTGRRSNRQILAINIATSFFGYMIIDSLEKWFSCNEKLKKIEWVKFNGNDLFKDVIAIGVDSIGDRDGTTAFTYGSPVSSVHGSSQLYLLNSCLLKIFKIVLRLFKTCIKLRFITMQWILRNVFLFLFKINSYLNLFSFFNLCCSPNKISFSIDSIASIAKTKWFWCYLPRTNITVGSLR